MGSPDRTVDIDPFITETAEDQQIAMTAVTTGYEMIEIENEISIVSQDTPPTILDAEPLPLSRTRSLSNKLNRSAPILFLKDHGQKLVGKKKPVDEERDRSWTNWWIGISCCCFLMPSMTILILRAWSDVRRCIIFDCIYFVIVAICSFLSDFVYCYVKDPPLPFETIDQWTATGGVVVVIVNILVNPYPLILRVCFFMVLGIALYLIGKSRKATTGQQWRKWHIIWHIFCGFTLSFIYVQEYLLKHSVISSDRLWWPW